MTGLVAGLLLLGMVAAMLAYLLGVGVGTQRSLTEVMRARTEAANARRAIQTITRASFEKMVAASERRRP